MVIINNMPTYNKAIITQVRRQSASQLQLMPSLCADRIQLQLCSYIARIPIVPVGWVGGGKGGITFSMQLKQEGALNRAVHRHIPQKCF